VKYIYARIYQNRAGFDEVIAKIKWYSFLAPRGMCKQRRWRSLWVVGQHSTAFFACGQSLFLSYHFRKILAFICWFM